MSTPDHARHGATTAMSQSLHMVLQRAGMLTPGQLEQSVQQATARNMSLWDLLVLEERVPEDGLADAFSQWLNTPRVRLDSVAIEPIALRAVPERIARLYTCLPLSLVGQDLRVAMANPLDRTAIQAIQFASSRMVQVAVAARTEILNAIDTHYPSHEARPSGSPAAATTVFSKVASERRELRLDQADPDAPADEAPAVEMCRAIVRDAIGVGASDIHVEPSATAVRVRLRVDGVLRDHLLVPRWLHGPLVSRFKILADLDIAQKRMPQDGRIAVTWNERRSDLRISTLPTQKGEKVVVRLLGSSSIPRMGALGLSAHEAALLEDAVGQPQGLILVTGPTGAGKSTTLYSMLARRHSPAVNIVTIEDPIEYQVEGINQVQVDAKAGLTFASSLRAILRQDPDVILVGEIRDAETAEIAFQAALTGHLVFTTLHTNSSVGAIGRLLDFGVKPLLITAATNVVIAQRLARRICTACREPYAPAADALRKLKMDAGSESFIHGKGCAACGHTGYAGRLGIFEILTLTPALKELITRHATEAEIRIAAKMAVTRFLLDDAVQKVRDGLTTAEEVVRVIRIERDDDAARNRLARRSEPNPHPH